MIHIFLAYDENFFSAYTAGRASLRACPPTRSVEKYRNNNCADDKRRVSRCKILLRKGYAILNKKKKRKKQKNERRMMAQRRTFVNHRLLSYTGVIHSNARPLKYLIELRRCKELITFRLDKNGIDTWW